jgi:hypothetical protein
MMTDIITVIAYKENSVDTCRGCVMDRYDSDLEMFSSDKPEAVADFVANLQAKDLDHYSSFNFTYLINGRCFHYDYTYVGENLSEELDYDIFSDQEEIITNIRQDANARTEVIAQQRQEVKEREQKAEKAREQAIQKKREREQYEKLKAQFEGENS